MTQTNDFLPEGFSLPVTSNYMKFKEGNNTFRILDKAIVGMEFWKLKEDGSGKTPVRRKMNELIMESELETDKEGNKVSAKFFMVFPVYNYSDKKIQILELTQKTLISAIKGYNDNPKWGNPINYDVTVTRTGQGKETEYLIDHDPKEEMDKEILKQYKAMNINLDALYVGGNPFEGKPLNETTIEEAIDEMEEPKNEMPF